MGTAFPLRIDAFCHIIPPGFKEKVLDASGPRFRSDSLSSLWELDRRMRTLDRFPGTVQVINLGARGAGGATGSRQKEIDFMRMANDEMAEIVFKYPEYFPAFVASLPVNDIEAAVKEIDRCVRDLKARGIQIHSPVGDKSMSDPIFEPIYQKMCEYDLPILVHPWTPAQFSRNKKEQAAAQPRFPSLDWPFETTNMMLAMTYSGLMQKYAGLKILTHHAGGAVPYYEQRLTTANDLFEMVPNSAYKSNLTRPPVEYLKKFYFDTATVGTAGLMCCYSFGGPEQMLFGTDYPHDNQQGDRSYRVTINAVEGMPISEKEKKMIFEDNARRIFRLPV